MSEDFAKFGLIRRNSDHTPGQINSRYGKNPSEDRAKTDFFYRKGTFLIYKELSSGFHGKAVAISYRALKFGWCLRSIFMGPWLWRYPRIKTVIRYCPAGVVIWIVWIGCRPGFPFWTVQLATGEYLEILPLASPLQLCRWMRGRGGEEYQIERDEPMLE